MIWNWSFSGNKSFKRDEKLLTQNELHGQLHVKILISRQNLSSRKAQNRPGLQKSAA